MRVAVVVVMLAGCFGQAHGATQLTVQIARGAYGFLEARNMIIDFDYLAIWDR